jgi:hypothetical protein
MSFLERNVATCNMSVVFGYLVGVADISALPDPALVRPWFVRVQAFSKVAQLAFFAESLFIFA